MKDKENIIIDTSVWIEYFNKSKSLFGEKVKKLLEEDSVVICGVIIAELLQGARDEREFKELRDCLLTVTFLEENSFIWEKVGKLSFDLKKSGKTIPLTDCLIAILAKENNCLIFTLDGHFKKIPEIKLYGV